MARYPIVNKVEVNDLFNKIIQGIFLIFLI